MERRRGVRFEIQLICRLKREGAHPPVEARTLNLGRLGALIEAGSSEYPASIPKAGDPVNLEVLLPVHSQFGQRCLACEAITVWATTEGERYLIALQFETVEIRKVAARAAADGSLAVM